MTTDCADGSCPPGSLAADASRTFVPQPAASEATSAAPADDASPAPKPKKADDPALLDPTTFVPPHPAQQTGFSIVIEFCDRCRWLHRAVWTQTELFLTFPPPAVRSISLVPLNTEETGGRFRVWLFGDDGLVKLVWDRKIEGGFPELKHLKQRVRDVIAPKTSLGHSDVHGK